MIDEWPNEESFQTFFSGAPRMREFLSGAGLSSDPTISVLQAVEAPGTFRERSADHRTNIFMNTTEGTILVPSVDPGAQFPGRVASGPLISSGGNAQRARSAQPGLGGPERLSRASERRSLGSGFGQANDLAAESSRRVPVSPTHACDSSASMTRCTSSMS